MSRRDREESEAEMAASKKMMKKMDEEEEKNIRIPEGDLDEAMSSAPLELEALPKRYKDVYDEIQSLVLEYLYVGVIGDIGDIQYHAEQREAELMKLLQESISELPDLPRASSKDHGSLLKLMCKPLYYRLRDHTAQQEVLGLLKAFHNPIRKFMVEKNPHALLWHHYEVSAFDSICDNKPHASDLLLWLIENYGDMLMGQKFKSAENHRAILRSYCNGFCPITTVRRLYQLFPEAIKQNVEEDSGGDYKNYPIHYVMVEEPEEADFELFRWMIQQHPQAVEVNDSSGQTILHRLFEDTIIPAQYANILINECPWIVYKKDKDGDLPIHELVRHRFRMSSFDEEDFKVLVRLLRRMYESKENPIDEIIDEMLENSPNYIGRVRGHLRRQHQLSLNAVAIKRVQAMIAKALDVDKSDQYLSEVDEIFSDWSKKHLPVIAKTIRNISEVEIPKVRLEVQVQAVL